MIKLANAGKFKRSHFSEALNKDVSKHYELTNRALKKMHPTYESNTRLRDCMKYLFEAGSDEEKRKFFEGLLVKLSMFQSELRIDHFNES